MSLYDVAWPMIRLLPAEWAHGLGLAALRLPIRWGAVVVDSFTWRGLTFRNRVGIAAGFDKNAVALPGIERLGVGFVEVGTILVAPWAGNPDRPRLQRLVAERAIWNRLGFPSDGLDAVEPRLAAFPKERRRGMLVGCNIGPHPGHLKAAESPEGYLGIALDELQTLVRRLHAHADIFVLNLSSPNTSGLRGMLRDRRLARELVMPLKRELERLDASQSQATPLLMKLPPEDPDRMPWSRESLEPIVMPLLEEHRCDGFVAVNTSTRLSEQMLHRDAGGVSGQPLLPIAVDVIRLLRAIVGSEPLILGGGGVTRPEDAVAIHQAGAELVGLYSGMIYHGPGLPAACARALAALPRSVPTPSSAGQLVS